MILFYIILLFFLYISKFQTNVIATNNVYYDNDANDSNFVQFHNILFKLNIIKNSMIRERDQDFLENSILKTPKTSLLNYELKFRLVSYPKYIS